MPGFLLRGMLAAICLLPPTILMGASLPAIVRWLKSTPNGVSWYGAAVRRQYGGRSIRLPAGGLLPAAASTTWRSATYAAAAINVVGGAGQLGAGRPHSGAGERAGNGGAMRRIAVDEADDGIPRWTDLCRDRTLRRDRAGRGSGVDAPAGHAAGAHGLHLLDHSGGVPDRARDWQRDRFAVDDAARACARAGAGAGRRFCSRWESRGPRGSLRNRCPTGRSIRCSRPVHGTRSNSIWCAACGPFCRPPCCGARVSRWPWPRLRVAARTPGETVGSVYAANTLGAIVGALGVSLVLIPWIGTQDSQRVLLWVSAGWRRARCWCRTCARQRSPGVSAALAAGVMLAAWLSSTSRRSPAN